MRAYLVEHGIPKNEIAFIHEAKTNAQKSRLFDNVNKGTVRVLIGSTGKMGVGMNAQERIVAIHHLDAPWRPGDVEQRDGRAFRQGNINKYVSKYVYVTTGSYDAKLWDTVNRKAKFINQVMSGDDIGRSVEDAGYVVLSAAELSAVSSGNPLVKEQFELYTEIDRLRDLKKAHDSSIVKAQSLLQKAERDIRTYEKNIENCKADIQQRTDAYTEDSFSMTIGKETYTDKREAGKALISTITSRIPLTTAGAMNTEPVSIGKFAGFALKATAHDGEYFGALVGHQPYQFYVHELTPTQSVGNAMKVAAQLEKRLETWESALADARKSVTEQKALMAEPFDKQEELDQKTRRYNEVMEILNPPDEQLITDDEDDGTQHQRRREYWRPSLSKSEWNLLNSKTEAEIAGNDKFLDEATKWLYSNEKGVEVFAIYGIGDGTVPTVLYASGGKTAGAEARKLSKFLEEYGTDRNRKVANEWTKAISSAKREFDSDYVPYGHRRKTLGLDNVLGELTKQHREYNGKENNGYGISDSGEIDDDQYQRREATLSDREVLSRAAHGLDVEGMTDAQRGALDVFKRRIDRLSELEMQRAEQGRLYKEQQFGKSVNREEAQKTLNRMHVLDEQIKKANDQVLEVEEKEVLRQVLKKARKVVENNQRAHDKALQSRKP